MKRSSWIFIAAASVAALWPCIDGSARAQGPRGRGCAGSSAGTSTLQRAMPATLGTGGYAAYQPALTTLSNDLVTSVANGGLSTLQARQLYRDVNGLLNSWPNQQLALAQIQADLSALTTATKLSAQDAQAISSDISAVIQAALPNVQVGASLAATR